jgi:predicted nucleotidyltransferase
MAKHIEIRGNDMNDSMRFKKKIYLCIYYGRVKYMNRPEIVQALKTILHQVAPKATVILYGSETRGEARKDSDIDLLIILPDKDKITLHDRRAITYPLYDVELETLETGVIISPKVFSKQQWKTQLAVTPFYHNVMKDGIVL